MNERTTEELASHLFNVEGFRAKPYRCTAGRLTVGVGFNLDDREDGREMLHSVGVDVSRYPNVEVTRGQAMELTKSLIAQHYSALVRKFPWVEGKPESAKFVLVDLSFNMGLGALSRFRNFLYLMEKSQYAAAALELLIRGDGNPEPTPYFTRVGTNRAFPLVARLATLDRTAQRDREIRAECVPVPAPIGFDPAPRPVDPRQDARAFSDTVGVHTFECEEDVRGLLSDPPEPVPTLVGLGRAFSTLSRLTRWVN